MWARQSGMPVRKRFGDRGCPARRRSSAIGVVPPLADSYFPRIETGFGLADGLRPGETIVLANAENGGVPGVGKTQLAVGFAHALWNNRAVDLLVWVPAGCRESIVASFAIAAGELDADHPGEVADVAAKRFLDWLSRTRRRWALIFDDVTSAADLDGLWPRGSSGQVVVTTRLPQMELASPDRKILGVSGFSRREGLGYLNSRLTGYPDQRIESLDLAEDVSGLPISLDQAAAVIMESDTTSREYRARYSERHRSTAGSLIDGCPPSMLATWSIAVERAHQLTPAGLAWPALSFAAMLATNGIPAAVLTSPPACAYITGQPADAGAADQKPGPLRLRQPGPARLGQPGQGQRGANRVAAHRRAGSGARLPAAWRRRAGRGRGGRGAG